MSDPATKDTTRLQMLAEPLKPALVFGACSGLAGLVLGNTVAVFRPDGSSRVPTAAGLQSFGLGFTFYYLRRTAFVVWNRPSYTTREKVLCSTAAGAVTGLMNGLVVTSRKSLPNIIVFGGLGMIGEATYQWLPESGRSKPKDPLMQRILESRWVPFQRMPDGKLEEMLREKTVGIEAEIADLDQKIAALKECRKNST